MIDQANEILENSAPSRKDLARWVNLPRLGKCLVRGFTVGNHEATSAVVEHDGKIIADSGPLPLGQLIGATTAAIVNALSLPTAQE